MSWRSGESERMDQWLIGDASQRPFFFAPRPGAGDGGGGVGYDTCNPQEGSHLYSGLSNRPPAVSIA